MAAARLLALFLAIQVALCHPPNVPLPSNAITIPLYLQETDFSCGPSSALALLRYWRWETYANVTERELYGPMNCTRKEGTDPPPIAAYLTNVASLPSIYVWGNNVTTEMLQNEIDHGYPPIIDFEAYSGNKTNYNDGHYNVLIGYDAVNFYMMDPSTNGRYAYVPIAEFMVRWHDIEGSGCPKQPCVEKSHMAILVRGNGTPHLQPNPPPDASYEP